MRNNFQMEFGLSHAICRSKRPQISRSRRADWWFEKMKQAAEEAEEWPTLSKRNVFSEFPGAKN
jgi:hypothetical protein